MKSILLESFKQLIKNESTEHLITYIKKPIQSTLLKRKHSEPQVTSKKPREIEINALCDFPNGYQVAAKVSLNPSDPPRWIAVKIHSFNATLMEYLVIDADESEESKKEWSLSVNALVDYQLFTPFKRDCMVMALYAFSKKEYSTAFYRATVVKRVKEFVYVVYEDGEKARLLTTQVFIEPVE